LLEDNLEKKGKKKEEKKTVGVSVVLGVCSNVSLIFLAVKFTIS